MFIVTIIALALSFFAMASVVFISNQSLTDSTPVSFSAGKIIEPVLSATAHGLIATTRQIIKSFSIRLLMTLHTLAAFGRAVLTRIEKRFSLLIDAVRGRGQTPDHRHRGSVSFFLEQIKDYKEEMTRRANIR